MKDLDKIGEELFSKLRGRFKTVTIGNEAGQVTNMPNESRFYEFEYNKGSKVSVSLDNDKISVMYSDKLFDDDQDATKQNWFDFLKELRTFAKKRLLNFDVRDIQKSNLNRRDYKFLANKTGDDTMTESKLYGTARLSYQDVDSARIVIKHTESVSENRTQKIGTIYIENADGERFKYPYKHVNGARAMARHVAEGGNQYDEFGKHILGLSEELNKLRKFKTYMTRSGVMAEGLSGYMDVVNERIDAVKNTVHKLQRKSFYTEMFDNYEAVVMEDVPEDVAGDWIDQLTIRQFNEELKDVFPYIYKLVSEATRAVELGPEELVDEASKGIEAMKKAGNAKADAEEKEDNDDMATAIKKKKDKSVEEELVDESGLQYYTGVKKHGKEYMKKAAQAGREGASQEELGRLKDKYSKAEKGKKAAEELELESMFDETMGQFAEGPDMDGPMDVKIGPDGALSKADGPDAKPEKPKLPIAEFILTMFDRETGKFPKGETAVLTAVEKDYGEEHIESAKMFIERILQKYEDVMVPMEPAMQEDDIEADEGNAYAHAVRKAKMDGKKKGDKIDGPDGDEITIELAKLAGIK